jgi:hypothetical protein
MALSTSLYWGDDARIAVEGVSGETAAEIAARWGATVETGGRSTGGGVEPRPLRTYSFLRGSTSRIVPTRINGGMWETVENGEAWWVASEDLRLPAGGTPAPQYGPSSHGTPAPQYGPSSRGTPAPQ